MLAMVRTIISVLLLAAGVATVCFTVFLFGQCVQIVNGNLSADTAVAQTVLRDVIRQVAADSPNGIKPPDVAGPLYTRLTTYGLFGLLLIAVAGWRQFRGTIQSTKPATFAPQTDSQQTE